jgi:hypothetical protein
LNEVRLATADQLPHMLAQLVTWVGQDVVKFIHRDEPIIEGLDAEFIDGEAKRRVRADQDFVFAAKEIFQRLYLAAIAAGLVAEVSARLHLPVCPEARLAQRLIGKARADGLLWHHNERLLHPLVLSLSSAMNISARLLPEAGGDLMSKYGSPRF